MAGQAVVNMVVMAEGDNVGIATRDIDAGDYAGDIHGQRVMTAEAIPQGHKVALAPIARDESVVRFGVPVGLMTAPAETGALVHVHNVTSQYLNNDRDHFE